MKVLVLTWELTPQHGWGRYSQDMLKALNQIDIQTIVAINRAGQNTTNIPVLRVLPYALDYRKNYFGAMWYAWRLRSYAKDCDIIHSFIEPYAYIAMWLARFTGKKYCVTSHGSMGVIPYTFPIYKSFFHKSAFAHASTIVCVSNYTKERLQVFGLNNLRVINNAIWFKEFYDNGLPFWDERKDVIVSVGALKKRKGYEVSLQAFSQAVKVRPELKYVIVGDQGDTKYFYTLQNLVSRLGIEDKVEFRRHISNQDLKNLYKSAKIFVLTSISEGANFEGFGLVYLEAGACGLPVIGSRDSGAEDAIQDGRSGYLVSQYDIDTVSEHIISISSNKGEFNQLSSGGVEWSRAHDWGNVISQYLNIYESL